MNERKRKVKRLLCILSSLDAGGAETFLMKIYRSLSPEDFQMDFVVSVENGCYTQEVLDRGGRIYAIPLRSKDPLDAFRGIQSAVRDNGYDSVLKLGENSLSVIDLIAAKRGGARNLALRSCNAPTGLSLPARCIHSLLKPLLNHFTTIKLAPSGLAAEYMFGKRSDVQLMHNGVDLNIFHFDVEGRAKIREEFGLGNKLIVGHIGQFREQKNHRYLLEVYKKIHEQRKESVLLLVGMGKQQKQICDWIKEFDLEDSVLLTGQRFDIPQLLSAMDVFVFPSFYEGMPNTVIEAQACGLPCVIADTITTEANITGLVHYLPLSEKAEYWAEKALSVISEVRYDTSQDFLKNGYDIKEVAKEFVSAFGIEC